MKVQFVAQGMNLVVFSEREIVEFDHFANVQAIRVMHVGVVGAEATSALGVLRFQGGKPSDGVRLQWRMEGVMPAICVTAELIVLAYDEQLVAIDVERQKRAFEYALNSAFREIIDTLGAVLVCSEADVEAFDANWKRLWRYSGDLIESCHVQGQTILVRFLDREPVRLSLKSGEPESDA